MQKWCSKFRSLSSALHWLAKPEKPSFPNPIPRRAIHISPNLIDKSNTNSVFSPEFKPRQNALRIPCHPSPPHPLSFLQVRHITAKKQRERKLKSRKPMTPITSKVKKIKIKGYSSFKGRFRVMNDGQIRRWKEGTRHNAHFKSKKAKRRLRRPATVPLAYAKVMKKLNFKG